LRAAARILSLDVGARGLPEVGRRDPLAGALLRRFPGLRPVCFYSAYEAAAWAIISHRINRVQAAALKSRLSEALGESVNIHGQPMQAFLSPGTLLSIEHFPGLFGAKLANLRAIGMAALSGELDATFLRSLPDDVALAHLQKLPGIGPFGSQLILLRGAGHPDFLTFVEPKFRAALSRAYGLDREPSNAELERISEPWRPYRTWITFLLRQRDTA
jgi:DNA-3-methyladenine glycosylase II